MAQQITPQKILRLTPKWTGWTGDSGGLISKNENHCCLAEGMIQAGFDREDLKFAGATMPRNLPLSTKVNNGWNSGARLTLFAKINDASEVQPDTFKNAGVLDVPSELERDSIGWKVLSDTPERKIRALRAVCHLLGYEQVVAEPPEGYDPMQWYS